MRFRWRDLHPGQLWQKSKTQQNSPADPMDALSRMERKRQMKESKTDHHLFRFSIYTFGLLCLVLGIMPLIYFLPWEQAAVWVVCLLLGALFLSFTLSTVTVKKQSKYVKLPYMWAIMIFSALLLLFYLFIMIYFRMLLP